MPVLIGQQSYKMFSALANPGQVVDLAFNEFESFPAAVTVPPGVAVELASDGLSVQPCQQTTTTFVPLGISVQNTARESQGAVGVTGYGVEGLSYQAGEMVRVLMRGRIFASWSGTTQTAFAYGTSGQPLHVWHSSTGANPQGVFTDAATSSVAGAEVAAAGSQFRVRQAQPGSGNIVELDVNLPGAV